nr:immunoglobulin heavy chain junction region [Macaca mulatta]
CVRLSSRYGLDSW